MSEGYPGEPGKTAVGNKGGKGGSGDRAISDLHDALNDLSSLEDRFAKIEAELAAIRQRNREIAAFLSTLTNDFE
jgi:hypothetical protein